jgi:hypothetical protein
MQFGAPRYKRYILCFGHIKGTLIPWHYTAGLKKKAGYFLKSSNQTFLLISSALQHKSMAK